MALSHHARGYLITVAGVLLLTPDTLLIRLADVDSFTLSVSRGAFGGVTVLAAAWAWQRGDGGRSFGYSGLHFDDNWKLPAYPRLLKRAVLWTMKLPLD